MIPPTEPLDELLELVVELELLDELEELEEELDEKPIGGFFAFPPGTPHAASCVVITVMHQKTIYFLLNFMTTVFQEKRVPETPLRAGAKAEESYNRIYDKTVLGHGIFVTSSTPIDGIRICCIIFLPGQPDPHRIMEFIID